MNALQPYLNRARAAWAARAPREQIALIAVAVVLLVAIYVQLVSALTTQRDAIARRLPGLLLSSYEMASGRPEAPRAAAGVREDLRSELFQILADRSLQAELRPLGSSQVEMRLPEQDARTLIRALHQIRLAANVRVASLQLRASETAGQASATAILERDR